MLPKLHILSNPNSPVHFNNRIDPFSIAVYKFIRDIQPLGWECIHYGVTGCEVNCQTVVCLNTLYSNYSKNVTEYNNNAAIEISKRKNKGDIVLCFYGFENRHAAEFNKDCIIIEPHIGYKLEAVFAPFRVFASYSQMHYFYGLHKLMNIPSWFDAVIHNAISANEFDYNENKKDYILYFGRVIKEKGLYIAIQATEATRHKLVIAGNGDLKSIGYDKTPSHVEVVGHCDIDQRRELMKYAKAIIGPTYYLEPFGNMIAEGYMSGTPAITSDWGGFVDNVVNGVTGYRCREFREFVWAIQNIDRIDPKQCRKWAMENCEDSVVIEKFDKYFRKIIHGDFYR